MHYPHSTLASGSRRQRKALIPLVRVASGTTASGAYDRSLRLTASAVKLGQPLLVGASLKVSHSHEVVDPESDDPIGQHTQ
jgi:hypothetical protein